jgi:hypothetical protein
MSIKAVVTQNGDLVKAKMTPQKNLLVTNYRIDVNNIALGDLTNIDTSAASDGALLMYNGNTSQWEAKTELDNNNTIVNGGNF